MIVSLESFKKFHGVETLEFKITSTGRQMCVSQLPAGVPQIFLAKTVTKKEDVNALWLSHPKDNPEVDILIAGNTKMADGFEI